MALRGECHSQFPFSPAVLKLVDVSLYFIFFPDPTASCVSKTQNDCDTIIFIKI